MFEKTYVIKDIHSKCIKKTFKSTRQTTQLKIWQYHYIPIKPDERKTKNPGGREVRKERNKKEKKHDNIKYWQKFRETRFLVHCWQEYKMVLPF